MLKAKRKYIFEPNYAIPPGETLLEVMESLDMKPGELADRLGLSLMTVNRILNGKQPITGNTATLLEHVTGVPASSWNNLEANYRAQLVKVQQIKEMEEHHEWFKQMPVRELVRRKVIPDDDRPLNLFRSLLTFFGVGSVSAWYQIWATPEVMARRSPSFETNLQAASAWIRLGEIEAGRIECEPFADNKSRFRESLDKIKCLTRESPDVFLPQIRTLCANAGVAFVLVKELPHVPWSGASKWLNPDKAMILLTIRGKSDDRFWFSFFHEAAHILNDSKKRLFINDNDPNQPEEQTANKFAADFLIPSEWEEKIRTVKTERDIRLIADELQVSAGIVVGRYQYLTKQYDRFNRLKLKFVWKTE